MVGILRQRVHPVKIRGQGCWYHSGRQASCVALPLPHAQGTHTVSLYLEARAEGVAWLLSMDPSHHSTLAQATPSPGLPSSQGLCPNSPHTHCSWPWCPVLPMPPSTPPPWSHHDYQSNQKDSHTLILELLSSLCLCSFSPFCGWIFQFPLDCQHPDNRICVLLCPPWFLHKDQRRHLNNFIRKYSNFTKIILYL